MSRWTKKSAIARINSNQRLVEIFQIAPPVKRLFNRIIRLNTIDLPYRYRFALYEYMEERLFFLVGEEAVDPSVRSDEDYELALDAASDLLNLDSIF